MAHDAHCHCSKENAMQQLMQGTYNPTEPSETCMVITVFERMYRYKESDAANHKLQLTSTKSLLYYKDHSGLGYSTTKTTVVLAW